MAFKDEHPDLAKIIQEAQQNCPPDKTDTMPMRTFTVRFRNNAEPDHVIEANSVNWGEVYTSLIKWRYADSYTAWHFANDVILMIDEK